MQTFLPYPDFCRSAECLDRQRLGKQRVEVLQLLRTLSSKTKGWQSHPATKMWRGHELDLISYGVAICDEWIARGYRDTCREKISTYVYRFGSSDECPPWLGNEEFHASHRSNLLRKDPDHYGQFGWIEPDNLEYVWPVS